MMKAVLPPAVIRPAFFCSPGYFTTTLIRIQGWIQHSKFYAKQVNAIVPEDLVRFVKSS
jgi:hypothetical protein